MIFMILEFDGCFVFVVKFIEVCLQEICNYVVEQNIIILCNWVNELGVVEFLV